MPFPRMINCADLQMPSQNKVIKEFPNFFTTIRCVNNLDFCCVIFLPKTQVYSKKTQTQAASHSALNGSRSPALRISRMFRRLQESGRLIILNLIIRYSTAIFVGILRGHPGGVRSCTGRSVAHSSGEFSDPARLGPQDKTPQLHHGSFEFGYLENWKIVLFRGKKILGQLIQQLGLSETLGEIQTQHNMSH